MATSTIPNRTIFIRDNLEVMRGMNSESIDLIYLDPPFNKGQEWSAPVGSKAAGAAFKDAWTLDDVKEEWVGEIEEANPALHHTIIAAGFTHGESMQGYLTYMAIRLLEMRRVLKLTGSIYLHCDSTASHYLKSLMDAVFGSDNFRNEIVWHYGGRGAKAIARQFARNHDVLLFYSNLFSKHTFERQYLERQFTPEEAKRAGFRQDEGSRWFKTSPRGDYTDESVKRLEAEGRIYRTRTGSVRVKYFLKQHGGKVVEDVLVGDTWSDIPDAMHIGKERLGYPTQKPLALLERVVNASSNEGDVVLDPFCGCATTCVCGREAGAPVDRHRPLRESLRPCRTAIGEGRQSRQCRASHAHRLEHRQAHGHPGADGRGREAAVPEHQGNALWQAGGLLQRLRHPLPPAQPNTRPHRAASEGRRRR